MVGMYESYFSTVNQTVGGVSPDGNLSIKTFTKTSGNQVLENEKQENYLSSKIIENKIFVSNEEVYRSSEKSPYAMSSLSRKNCLEWYSDFIPSSKDLIFASARKINTDEKIALSIAEAAAVASLISNIKIEVQYSSNAKMIY